MNHPRGFLLFETLVSILITLLLLLAIYSIFILSQRTERLIVNRAEITQNQRTILDRISRELRQANSVVTTLPNSEIEFEDGHGTLSGEPIEYIRYHLLSTNLYRELSYYYFATDPATHVHYNEVDSLGSPPLVSIVEDRLMGEYINSLSFSGGGTITISIGFVKDNQTKTITTDVSPRNLN